MKIIRNAETVRISCLGKQKINTSTCYRLLTYTTLIPIDEGFLLYNNLTDELVLLSKTEKDSLDSIDISNDLHKVLIEKWFFVPNDHIDVALNRQIDAFLALFINNITPDSKLNEYTIFPTTDCNARCFYCYEKGIKMIHMSDKTAADVAHFIIKRSKGDKVKLRWFGGEPLYNSRAIDIICKILKENAVDFSCGMITNGYLFDDEMVDKAKSLWNLKRVQITLDGTEEKYNKIKAFIYPNVNAFEIVISNIKRLLDAGIFVAIRMNMDNHNYENLFELTEFLYNKFGKYKNIVIYSQTLFDESGPKQMSRTDEDKVTLFKNNQLLNAHTSKIGVYKKSTLSGYLKTHQCMADNLFATTITPDGSLGKCEHFSDKYLWGSIYSDDIDASAIKLFSKRVPLEGKCDICPVRPGCVQLEMCPNSPNCNDILRESHIFNVKNRILNTYEEWKSSQ